MELNGGAFSHGPEWLSTMDGISLLQTMLDMNEPYNGVVLDWCVIFTGS